MLAEDYLSRVTGTTYLAIVGQVIVLRRKDMGLNQSDLAKKIGVSQSAWSRTEKGLSNLSVAQLIKVADTLEILPGEIIANADEAKIELERNGIQVARKEHDTAGWLLLGSAAIKLAILASQENEQ